MESGVAKVDLEENDLQVREVLEGVDVKKEYGVKKWRCFLGRFRRCMGMLGKRCRGLGLRGWI